MLNHLLRKQGIWMLIICLSVSYLHVAASPIIFVDDKTIDVYDNAPKESSASSLYELADAFDNPNSTITDVTCFGGSDGAIDITISGGTPPYTYSWSNGATTQDLTNIPAGNYTITVTNSLGCIQTKLKVVNQPTQITVSSTNTQPSCNTANGALTGAIDLTASGGTGSLTYLWSSGQTTADLTGLGSGTYTVTVTDANGCTATFTTTLTEPSAIVISSINVQPSCNTSNGALTGSIDLTASGGTGAFTYLWSSGQTSADISGLGSGTYTVTVTDANGCTATYSTTLTEPTAIIISSVDVQPSCNTSNGALTGAIDLTATGGTGAFTYLWSSGQTTADLTGLGSGTYTVTVTDVNGCTATFTTTLTEPTAILISSVDVQPSCNTSNGALTGAIDLTASGGTGSFTYLWSSGQTTADLTGLGSGTYTVTVTDANGCTATFSTTLTEPNAILISSVDVQPSCNTSNGALTGSIDLTARGGTGSLTYAWSSGQTTADLTGLGSGTYTVTVTDANGCTATFTTTLTEPTAILISSVNIQPSCNTANGALTGSIDLTASGGTGSLTYAME